MHIVFWLVKDSCWMLELRWIGGAMIIPTVFLAIYLMIKTLGTRDFYLNTAIFFWISANSYWMIVELFFNDVYRYFATIPFALGFLFIILFYLNSSSYKNQSSLNKQ